MELNEKVPPTDGPEGVLVEDVARRGTPAEEAPAPEGPVAACMFSGGAPMRDGPP
ncbi:hypothetical protein Tcur_4979 [Thermomonospora curvata DSM 43183]|uniref:Uncharacterized protein n=1 Tax=Thermomonospora curvata (strain ATCC 19995 / DSM 43183 / JCM 3096 / KCTC 9072 / NBRC 15933 / NCIMB 10081 / Henssen B9) TaxID=471852 RepID=D1A964_THECD|nr:hypothetical protein Tcur_4979 [Thermomonospora curvata DSM 43183]